MSKEAEARKVVIEYCRKLYDSGMLPGNDGNISVRVDEDTAIITPSGVSKWAVTEDELVYMKITGEKISGHKNPSCESPMHLAVYANRKDVGAVIHAHSPNVIAFAMARKHIDTRYAPFAYVHLGIVADIAYYAPGALGLHKSVVEAVNNGNNAMVLHNHGSMVLGETMPDAFIKTDLLEAYAGMLIKSSLLGGACMMTDEELKEIPCG